MTKVLIFAVCDYVSLPNGGEVMLLNNFLSANNSETIEYYLVGMSFSKEDIVGKWTIKKIGEKSYQFFPVAQVLADKEKTHIPFRLRMAYGIKKYWKEINDIGPNYHYIHSAELAIPMWRKDINLVYHVHGDPCQTLKISRFPLFRMQFFTTLYWRIIRNTIEKSQKIIWAADRSKRLYLEQQPHMYEVVHKKSITIHSSFDTKMIIDDKTIPLLANRKHLVTVGRLSKVKRIDFILLVLAKMIKENENIDLIVCGDGEEMLSLRKQAEYLKIVDRVFFLGLTNRIQTATALAKSDVFVFASENEAMSLVVLESLYMGTPVVSTNVGDIPCAIKNGETGYIVNGYDIATFSNRIREVLKKKKYYYSDNCKTMAMKFTPGRMAKEINEVFYGDCD